MTDRKGFLGSSDIAAVCGLSKWKTPLKLFAEKTGLVEPDDLSDNEAVEWGKRLEEPVAQKFSEKHDVKIMAYKKRYTHPEHKFLSCELDRIITGTETIVEVKTCSAYLMRDWEGEEYPLSYELQVQFAMGLSNRKKAYLVCLIGGQKYVEKKLEFDQELFDDMIKRAVDFWQMVQDKTPPIAVSGDKDILSQLYPGDSELEVMELEMSSNDDVKVTGLLGEISAMKDEIKYCEKAQEKAENGVKQLMGNTEVLITGDGDKVSWKPQITRRLDGKKLKKEKPELYEEYSYKKESRVFRVSEKKEKKDK